MTAGTVVLALALLQGQGAEGLSQKALELARSGRGAEAAELWKKALAAAPGHFESLFNLGYYYTTQGEAAEAEKYLARAAKVRPADFNTRYLLGNALASLERREEALLQWQAALAGQPSNVRLMLVMAVEYGKGRYFREACEVARRALRVAPAEAKVHFVAIKACDDARDPDILEMTRATVLRFPNDARANFEYGFQLQRAGQREEAMPYLKKAMQGDANYEEPFFFYGDLLLLEDRYDEAARHLKRALEIRPDYVAACVSLAKALMAQEKYGEAVGELEDCAAKNPVHPQPHLLLSQVYFRMGQEERAAAEKNLSMKLRREHPEIMESPQARPFPKLATAAAPQPPGGARQRPR
jgi:tetratricopeptide (TPR) repeat protein